MRIRKSSPNERGREEGERENLEGAKLTRDSPERFSRSTSRPTNRVRGDLGSSRARPPVLLLSFGLFQSWARWQLSSHQITQSRNLTLLILSPPQDSLSWHNTFSKQHGSLVECLTANILVCVRFPLAPQHFFCSLSFFQSMWPHLPMSIGEYCSQRTEIQQYSLEMDRDSYLASVISKIAGK